MSRLRDIENAIVTLQGKVEAYKPRSGTGISVTDGAAGSGRMISLAPVGQESPADADSPLQPFQLVDASNDDDGPQVRVVESTIFGDLPDGFSPGDVPPFIVAVADGDRIYGAITIDVSGEFPGDVTSRTIGVDASVPADDPEAGEFYLLIGTVAVGDTTSPSNARYGPLDGTCYRVWFANPKQFEVAWA